MEREHIRRLSPMIIAAAALLAATGAQAHTHMLKAAPAANASVGAPKTIQLQFSARLESKFSGIELTKVGGGMVPVEAAPAAKDGKSLAATVKTPLTPGVYKVSWHAVAGDGHRMKGDYSFTVR